MIFIFYIIKNSSSCTFEPIRISVSEIYKIFWWNISIDSR